MNSENLMQVCKDINDANYPIQELVIQEAKAVVIVIQRLIR